MKGLNIKGLIKQIKQTKHNFIWSYSDKGHFLTNRHWAITLEVLPVEVLLTLLQIFEGDRPDIGQCFYKSRGTISKNHNIPSPVLGNDCVEYEWTDYYKDYKYPSDGLMRIFKSNDQIMFINNDYLHAVEWRHRAVSEGYSRPIHFPEINYMVLPFRINDHEDLLKIMTMAGDSNGTS